MESDDCPICTDPLVGSLAIIGCCKKTMHVECLVKCMKEKLSCPMCRAHHESLRMVQDVESQVLVPVFYQRNQNLFRNIFTFTFCVAIVIISTTHYYG
jgi:hypothetical protein